MKKFKVYQLRRENEVINDYKEIYDARMKVIAEYEISSDKNDPIIISEDIWHLCNVHCWDSSWHDGEWVQKDDITLTPTSDFDGFCNSDIVVETEDGLYLAESFGFMKVNSLEDASYRIIARFPFISWCNMRNKNEYNKDKLDEIKRQIDYENILKLEEYNKNKK